MSLRSEIVARDGSTFPGRSFTEAVLEPIYDEAKTNLLLPMMDVHRSHLVMLVEQGLVSREVARRILAALDSLDLDDLAHSVYDGRYEDLFFHVEDLLLQRAGEVAGNLHIARSRNDMGVTIYRMVLRERILAVTAAALELYKSFLAMAEEHAETVMLAHTHTQQAQPTTLGHWLLAAADVLGRDIGRLQEAYGTVNLSPMGAAAFSTSGFAIKRELVADLLGFDGLVENSYDAIAGADYLSGTAAAIILISLHTGRVVQDLLQWCTNEFSRVRVADPYFQISSIMPQKRNPVSLEHSRALLSSAAGNATTVLQMLHNTPFGDIVDTEDDMQPYLWRSLETVKRVFHLLAAVIITMEVDRGRLLDQARASYANVTELADTLVRDCGLPFRTAHRVVAVAVKKALQRGCGDVRQLEPELLEEAAREILGHNLGLKPQQFEQALDPQHFVAVRQVRGGVAPVEVKRMLAERAGRETALSAWVATARQRLQEARTRLATACQALQG